jgi:hypothetical protein
MCRVRSVGLYHNDQALLATRSNYPERIKEPIRKCRIYLRILCSPVTQSAQFR